MINGAPRRVKGVAKVKKVDGFSRILLFAVAWCIACVLLFSGRQLYLQVCTPDRNCFVQSFKSYPISAPIIALALPSSFFASCRQSAPAQFSCNPRPNDARLEYLTHVETLHRQMPKKAKLKSSGTGSIGATLAINKLMKPSSSEVSLSKAAAPVSDILNKTSFQPDVRHDAPSTEDSSESETENADQGQNPVTNKNMSDSGDSSDGRPGRDTSSSSKSAASKRKSKARGVLKNALGQPIGV
jgi:hypothetical protein